MTDPAEVEDLYERAPCGLHSLDAEGLFLFVNDTELRWLGYARDEVVGKLRFVDLLDEAGRATFAANFPRFQAQGHIEDLEFDLRRKDGTTLPVLLSATAVVDAAGRFHHSRSVVVDITRRRRAEAALAAAVAEAQARRRELDGFFELSLDLLCIAGFDGRFRRLNAAWEAVLGFSTAELCAEPFLSFVHPDDRDATTAAFAGILDGGRVRDFENRYRCKGGGYRWLSWSSIGVPDAQVVYAAARDVSARRETEALVRAQTEELRAQGEELRAQRRLLEERNVEVERASQLKSEFLANMSHELRTPLNSVIGFSELLLEDGQATLTPLQVKHLGIVRASGRHLLELINDLLDLAKIEAGRVRLAPEPLDPAEVVAEAMALVEADARRKRLRLTADVRAGRPVLGDRARVRQVLLNLLANAVKFTPEGGAVDVGAVEAGVFGRFWVRDTGPGIPDGLRPRLFEPFVQGESPLVKRHEGTGLGLAISKGLVEQHGGTIEVASIPGCGSTFSFTIPAVAPPAAVEAPAVFLAPSAPAAPAVQPRARPGSPAAAPDDRAPGGRPCVVVVDDDPGARGLLRAWLVEAGCDVLEAATGADGLALVARVRPQLVVLDVVLPGDDGLRVLEALEADPGLREIPVVLVSAHDDGARGLALGALELFRKPIDRQAFLARLEACVAASPARGAPTVLLIDDDPAVATLLRPTLEAAGFAVLTAASGREGLDRARGDRPCAVVVDLMLPDMSGFEVVDALARDAATRDLPVLVLTAAELDEADRARLRAHARVLAEKGEFTREALLAALRRAVAGPAPRRPGVPAVLVVDDHDLNRELACALLERRGHPVLVARDGLEALDVARRERPALILMDLAMPGLDGFEAARRLRADPATAATPIVAFTALAMRRDEERARAAGFDGYLTKPLEPAALERALAALLPWPGG